MINIKFQGLKGKYEIKKMSRDKSLGSSVRTYMAIGKSNPMTAKTDKLFSWKS